MDDKEFLERIRQKSVELRSNSQKNKPNTYSFPKYNLPIKPTSADPPLSSEKENSDTPRKVNKNIEAILADFRKKTAEQTRSAHDRSLIPSDRPSARPDDRQVMQDMISTMRELTEEVKHLRTQIRTTPDASATYPSERPPGIPQVADLVTLSPELTEPVPELTTIDESDLLDIPGITDLPDIPEETETLPELEETSAKPKRKKRKKKTALSVVVNLFFYVIVAAMIFGAFLVKSGSGGRPTVIAGYSAFTVLTSSMEDVYPRGSLIITKSVDTNQLKIGDDITYMVSETSSITHRIVGITENFQETGERAFETKGVMNPAADKDPVAASNVVGKVVFHSEALGTMAAFVSKNWPFLLFFVIVLIILFSFLKWNARKSAVKEEASQNSSDADLKTLPQKRKKRKSKKTPEKE